MRFVPVNELQEGMVLAWDIISPNKSFMLKTGVALSNDYINYLQTKGYLGAYVNDEESANIYPEIAVDQKAIVKGITAVENADIDGLMESASAIVANITEKSAVHVDIMDLRSFDDYTYHHSVNVAVYSVAVGKYMGLPDEELNLLCQAGLFHDLGKRKIPLEVLNKPDKLTDEEFQEIKNHPRYSYDMLYKRSDIPSQVRKMVISHHENENGSGYPNGLDGSQLTTAEKILHAVDVYDALISRRPYKDPYAPVDAFEYLMGGKDILFNGEVVEAMRHVIPTYPIATEVMLSNGQVAIVVEHTTDPLRPIVRIKENQVYINLSLPTFSSLFIIASGVFSFDYSHAVEQLNESRLTTKIKQKEIMLVDDSIISLQQTATALEDKNYHITALQSGMAAVNYIKEKGAPDLVIMDIEMPIMNGISTVANIRKLGYYDLPIIFLTAKGDKETVMMCIDANAKDYIIKPVRPQYLRARVAIALDASLER